ncbi:ABC transporter substrate-binding protein [Actinomadura macrotermitis]|uniref:Serine/threonine-protein kinase PknD n=1 Tax=Actinomadura macrotermitis TaxID=2585200 RepID=A0A7K0C3Z7_9ACTN|nr:ABC transporter substrate-binding protein [Actinomadura macrotermitis]MQY08180.1 Serine/threonine-protein kinase PknD [Actinomadura macrotermitis]
MPDPTPLRGGDPDALGPYRLLGLLGEGGQGSVYLGEDPEGVRVAVKLLHARFSGDPRARSRFAAEVAVAQRVAPFCTARLLDSDVQGDRPYIVSEYIDGPSLAEVLSRYGPRRGSDLDRLAIGTMTALAAIHEAGVVHRDFKPGNVLLAADGPRVIDFGIARALDATGTLSSTAVGTPAYMAPEQISGTPVGPAADVWAWGATMVYAAGGRPAFGQDSIPAVMHRILNAPPDLGRLPEPLRSLAADCLAKDPALRPSAQQVLIRLLTLAGGLRAPAGAVPADVLGQGAAAAVTGTFAAPPPPVPAPAPPTTPPPGPIQPPWHQQQTMPPHPSGGGSRRRIGILAGVAGAAFIAVAVALAAVLVPDGEPTPTTTTLRPGGELRMVAAPPSDGDALDPSHSSGGTGRMVAKQLFTGLTDVSADGSVTKRLATSVTPQDGCKSWQIEIRTGTTFSNGEPVDAEAFVRGWTRNAQNQLGPASYVMAGVQGLNEVISGKSQILSGVKAAGSTLRVTLDTKDCEFEQRLADPVFYPAPKDAGRADNTAYNNRPIGNGPFKVDSYTPKSSLVLAPNTAWAFGRARLDRVSVRLAENTTTAALGGDADWARADTTTLSALRGKPNAVQRDAPFSRLLVPLVARGPMSTREGRLAVSYALDRQVISDAVYGGFYRPAHGIVPKAIPGFGRPGACASCEGQNPTEAKTNAAKAKLGAGTGLNLYVRTESSQQKIAEVVQEQLTRVLGWKVTIKTLPLGDLRKMSAAVTAKDASGLLVLGWGPDYPSGASMLRSLLRSDQAATATNSLSNYGGWKNPGFDGLLDQALADPVAATRTQHVLSAEKVALDDMALIPLLDFGSVAVRSGRFTGLDLDYDGDPTLATAAQR